MTRRRPAFYGVVGVALACAGCGHDAPVAAIDHTAVCSDPSLASQIKTLLLEGEGAGGKVYRHRVRAARVVLGDVALVRYDDATGRAECSASLRLTSPIIPDDARASQGIAFAVRTGADGAPTVSNLAAADGADLGRFAERLRPQKAASAAPPPPAPPPPISSDAAIADPTLADPSIADASPSMSAESRALLDQAGDTRAARTRASDADAPPPVSATP